LRKVDILTVSLIASVEKAIVHEATEEGQKEKLEKEVTMVLVVVLLFVNRIIMCVVQMCSGSIGTLGTSAFG
jgi:hypothetical protein